MVSIFVLTSGIFSPVTTMAASISQASAIFGRLKMSTPAESVIIQYKTPTGVTAGQNILISFGTSFTLAALTYANIDMAISNDGNCTAFTDVTLAAAPSGETWGATASGNAVNLVSGSGAVPAGYCVRVKFGTVATVGGTGATTDVSIGSSATNPTITIGGSGDTGVITIALADDDQVFITAQVNQTLAFDLDTTTVSQTEGPYYTGTGLDESAPQYSVDLGVLAAGTAPASSDTSSINMIAVEALTNASGGMNITVQNKNGANGLVSASDSASKIPNLAGTMATNTKNYGICVATANLAYLTRSGDYATGTCVLAGEANDVENLTVAPAPILSAPGPISDSHAEIVVNAAIDSSIPAHTDYQDTLTFIATASF